VEFLIVLATLFVVVLVVTGPLRREYATRARTGAQADLAGPPETELGELEAARDAKYREIRDAELDHRTGKLSDADFEAIDETLRAEAVEILHQLDRLAQAPRPGSRDGSEREQPPAG
jgi:hypothetical protein